MRSREAGADRRRRSLRACVYAHGQDKLSFTERVNRAFDLLAEGLRRGNSIKKR